MPQRMLRIEEPPPSKEPLLTLGTVKWIFDTSVKLLPFLLFALQFYANQSAISEKAESNRKSIEKLQTDLNRLNRETTKAAADVEALQRIQDNDRQFYLQTTPPPGRRR